jgi:lipopolysaccharide transport system ATP-binding protein
MSDIAVRVQDLGKQYRLGVRGAWNQPMLREVVSGLVARPFRYLSGAARRSGGGTGSTAAATPSHIWALRGVSFDVKPGEVLGIIGPNGAGKSTLLKILSRITEPTEGRVEIHGRVASLLEVGTGFHPELSGRENVYLSGAFLGMRKAEIDRKLDTIIDFSGIAKFIETPVKYYSSGMYVRLAFAVAAHLEPDILIVDEVLAVGDADFQRRCLAKMEDVRQRGRTILFVSHNLSAITRLCQRAILVAGGSIRNDGPAGDVVSAYMMSNLSTATERSWPDQAAAPGNDVARLRGVRVSAHDGRTAESVDIRRPVTIEMVYDVLKPGYSFAPRCEIFSHSGLCIFTAADMRIGWRDRPCPIGRFTSTATIPGNMLAEGTFLVGVSLFSPDPDQNHFHVREAVAFQVIDSLEGDSARGDWTGPMYGVVRPALDWNTTPVNSTSANP